MAKAPATIDVTITGAKPWWCSKTIWGLVIGLVSAILAETVAPATVDTILWVVAGLAQALAVRGRLVAGERIVLGNQARNLGSGAGPGATKPSRPTGRATNVLALLLLVGAVTACPAGHRALIATGTHTANAAVCLMACACTPPDVCLDDEMCAVNCAVRHGAGLAVEMIQIMRDAFAEGATSLELMMPPLKDAPDLGTGGDE